MADATTSEPRALHRYLPITAWLPSYDRRWLRPDIIAGLTVWALLVPEAMAYADMAGMPPETGLYAALGAIVGYAVFGTSRQLFVGPSSTVAILSFTTVAAIATTDNFVDLTIALALLVGVIFVLAGIARLGFVSVFLSKPVLTGFTFGLGLTIAIGQADKIFGVEGASGNFFDKFWGLLQELPDADLRTTVIGLVSLAALFIMGRIWGHKVPGALILLVAAVILSVVLDWEDKGVHVVEDIPASLPTIGLPDVSGGDLWSLLPGAIGIVLVGYAESFGVAQGFARRHDYKIDANQEMIGLGAANVGAGIFGGFVCDGSLSRSSAADEAGAKSQMAFLLCGVATVVTIAVLTPFFEPLPEAVLGAIVIHAVWGTFNVTEMRRLWRTNRADFAAALAALLGVCALDLLPGLLLAVLVSFVMLVYRAYRPPMPRLGRVPEFGAFVSTETYPLAKEMPDVIVVRIDAPLIFVNAEAFHERITELRTEEPRAIVLDLETTHFIDTDGGDEMRQIAEELHEHGIELVVARLNMNGREALRRVGAYDVIGEDRFFPSVRSATASVEPGRTVAPEDFPEMRDAGDDKVSDD